MTHCHEPVSLFARILVLQVGNLELDGSNLVLLVRETLLISGKDVYKRQQ